MSASISARPLPITLNLHITRACNYACEHCWAPFRDVPGELGRDAWLRVLDRLAANPTPAPGCVVDKITFAGGEPTLKRFLPDLVIAAKRHGFVTCVVTNGTRVTDEFLREVGPSLDWITFSLDSADDATNARIGRRLRRSATSDAVATIRSAARRVRGHPHVRVRLNTVVVAENHDEDMSEIVREIAPDRWKVLQGTRIDGQNDGTADRFEITPAQYVGYLDRHWALAPVPEPTDAILGSYLMLDPLGRVFCNGTGRYVYSQPVLEVGLAAAAAQGRWSPARFDARGGSWEWRPE
jgi:radical S-adenosyl methionine domain-containing protein 2